MQTRKRRRNKRRTKRGGLGPEVYMMTGMIAVLNGLMMSFPSIGTHDNPCDTPEAKAIPVDDVPLATPIDDPVATLVPTEKPDIQNDTKK